MPANPSTSHSSRVEGSPNPSNYPMNFDLPWQVVGRRGKPNKGGRKPSAPPPERPLLVEGVQKVKKKSKKQRWKARLRALAEAAGNTVSGNTPPGPACSGTGELRAAAVGGGGIGHGAAQPTAKPSTSRQPTRGSQSRAQRSAARVPKRDRDAARRERLAESESPQVAPKRQRLETSAQPGPSSTYAKVARTELGVAITTAVSGILSKEAADSVMRSLHRGLMREADMRAPDDPWGPVFRGKPSWEEGHLKLWCADQRTADWLKGLVCGITAPSGEALAVKSFSELPRRVRCGILIPNEQNLWESTREIGKALVLQNKWAECDKWMLHSADKQQDGWFLVVSIPERLVPTITKHERRLACGFGAVYLKFQGPGGKFYESPPGPGAGSEGLKITGVQMPSTSAGPSAATEVRSPPCQREEGARASPQSVTRPDIAEEDLGSSPMDPHMLMDEETGRMLSDLFLGEEEEPPNNGDPSHP